MGTTKKMEITCQVCHQLNIILSHNNQTSSDQLNKLKDKLMQLQWSISENWNSLVPGVQSLENVRYITNNKTTMLK